MPKLKPYRFKKLVKKLQDFDSRFEVLTEKGKGSHRMLYHPDIGGKSESFPLICHGNNVEIAKCYIADIIRRFKLPDGVL